jgi:hypothetical protein
VYTKNLSGREECTVCDREKEIRGSGVSLEPPGASSKSSYAPPYRLYGVFWVPAHPLEPLDEKTCFSQFCDEGLPNAEDPVNEEKLHAGHTLLRYEPIIDLSPLPNYTNYTQLHPIR